MFFLPLGTKQIAKHVRQLLLPFGASKVMQMSSIWKDLKSFARLFVLD
jgi:hypothetical protein